MRLRSGNAGAFSAGDMEAARREIDAIEREERESKAAFEKSGKQMINNLTPDDRRARGLPPYSLSADEQRRMSGVMTEKEKEDKRLFEEKAAAQNAETGRKVIEAVYLGYYGDWTPEYRDLFRRAWIAKWSNMTRSEKYQSLLRNNGPPWNKINNCTSHVPVDPNDPGISSFDKDLYYDFTVPECGMEWEWYNTPGVNLGNPLQRAALVTKFTPSVSAEGGIILKNAVDGAKVILPKLEVPYYFTVVAGVIIMVAIAVIKVG